MFTNYFDWLKCRQITSLLLWSIKYVSKCLPGMQCYYQILLHFLVVFLLQAAAKMQELCKGFKKLDFKTQGLPN